MRKNFLSYCLAVTSYIIFSACNPSTNHKLLPLGVIEGMKNTDSFQFSSSVLDSGFWTCPITRIIEGEKITGEAIMKSGHKVDTSKVLEKGDDGLYYDTVSRGTMCAYGIRNNKALINSESLFGFKTNRRSMNLKTGEGYFEVGDDSIIVKTRDTIEIVARKGACFNITSYGISLCDSMFTHVAVLKGSVKIYQPYKVPLYISEGHGISFVGTDLYTEGIIDTADVTRWTRSSFCYNSVHYRSLIARLARWYDINIALSCLITTPGITHFKGYFSQSITTVLTALNNKVPTLRCKGKGNEAWVEKL